MFKKLLVVGDSVMSGQELVQCEDSWQDKLKDFCNKHKLTPERDGTVPFSQQTLSIYDEYFKFEESMCNGATMHEKGKYYSIGGVIQRELKIPEYKNFAFPGYSNNAIMHTLIQNLSYIDDETFVIIGLTMADRTARLNEVHSDDRVKCYNLYRFFPEMLNSSATLSLLDKMDDNLSQYLTVHNMILAIQNLLVGKNYIIIDYKNNYRENVDILPDNLNNVFSNVIEHNVLMFSDKINRPDTVQYIQKFFNDTIFPYTFFHSGRLLTDQGKPWRCILGHPNAESHDLLAKNYVIPHIIKMFIERSKC